MVVSLRRSPEGSISVTVLQAIRSIQWERRASSKEKWLPCICLLGMVRSLFVSLRSFQQLSTCSSGIIGYDRPNLVYYRRKGFLAGWSACSGGGDRGSGPRALVLSITRCGYKNKEDKATCFNRSDSRLANRMCMREVGWEMEWVRWG